jgi:hypothetical protein
MQIEQAVAARVGPFRLDVVASPPGSTTLLNCSSLITSLSEGTFENLYLLRRGIKDDGTPVPGFLTGDRVRTVASQISGVLTPDAPWTNPVIAGELFEIHHLDPVNELRPAVLAGLRKCYFTDRVSVTLSSIAPEFDLTVLAPWVTRPGDVEDVAWNYPNAQTPPVPAYWFRPFQEGGHVWLAIWPNPYPQNLLVSARRSYFTLVNSVTQVSGPTLDTDTVDCSLEWAAAAGHSEAWKTCKPRLQPMVNAGWGMTQKEAADEFTRLRVANYDPPVRREQFSRPFTMSGFGLGRL